MAIPILSRRTERKQAALSAAVEAGVEKAMSRDIVAAAANSQGRAVSGATYIPNPSSPFAQTAGQVPGYVPLPRPLGDFNSGFGPGVPLFPDAIDALGPGGRALPRRAQYLVAINLQLADRALPWTALKWIAEECDVVNRCIQLVQDGICGRDWSWGYSDSIIEQIMRDTGEANHARAMALAADKYGTELDRVKSFFERPDQRSKHSPSQWLAEIIWQSLVYDGICIYPQRTLGGDLFALAPIDTSTIKILLDNQGFPPEPPAPAFQQILYGFPRGEFQAGDGPVEGEFASDQLAYYIRRPRPESVYGYPPTEEVMTVATTYLQRQAWMRSEYVYGMSPKTYYTMDKDNPTGWTPEQQFGYEQTMNDRLSGQINRRQQAFLLPPGMKPEWPPQIEEHYKSDYDNFLIIQMGSKFGVPATQLGVQAKAGLSGGRQMEGEEDQTEHFVTEAFVNFLIDVQNDLARRYLGIGREITATCQDTGGSEQDILQQANADTQTVNNGRITLNDWRAKNGLPLYSMPEADEPFIAGAQGPVFLKGTLAVQDANTEATLNPPEPPKQVFVGPDGKPLPTAPDGSPVPPPAANNGGTDANANGSTPDDNSGRKPTGSAAGGTSTDSDGNTELTGSSPSKDSSASDSKSESDTDAEKELKSFVKFAKARIDRGSWRDFSFSAVASVQGRHLNDLGRAGDLDAIKSVVNAQPDAAGIIVLAADTGRVLMVQRVNDDHLAPGTWEWPGGQCHKGEDAFSGATREWQAEVGLPLPQGDITGSWLTPDGTYQAFVLQIKHESAIDLGDVTDRDTGEIAAAAWWEPSDVVGNSAVRVECQSSDWSLLGAVKSAQAYDLNPRSGMISLDVPDGVITPLSGGITDFHLTVVYLGPDVDDKSFAEACDAARKAAKDAPGPLTGTISGIASFAPSASSDGLKPVYVVPNIAGITDLREALEDLSASEHDFMPHITLAYLDPDDPLPKPLPLTPLTFDYLSVHRGDEVVRFALGGDKANNAVKADPKDPAHSRGLTTPEQLAKWGDSWETQERNAQGEFGSGGGHVTSYEDLYGRGGGRTSSPSASRPPDVTGGSHNEDGARTAHISGGGGRAAASSGESNPCVYSPPFEGMKPTAAERQLAAIHDAGTFKEERPLTASEARAVSDYTRPAGGADVNIGLRESGSTRGFAGQVKGLDSAIASRTVTADTTVYRGFTNAAPLEGLKVGDTYHDPGYESTTMLREMANQYGDFRPGHNVEINIPAGSHALMTWTGQGEVILPRGSDYVVTGIKKDGTIQFTVQTPSAAKSVGSWTLPPWLAKATHPIDALRDAIVAHYAPLLTAALKHSTKGLHQAIDEAQRKTAAKAVADAGGGADDQGIAQSAAAMNVTVAQSSAAQILRDLIAESYMVGSHAAAQQISPDAQMAIGTALSWDDWTPGSIQASDLVANGGLQQLLEQAGITIKSAIDNGIDRVGNVLADGIARGDSVDTIATSLSDAVTANAYMIADTECCRAAETASQDTYEVNGISQWGWIAEDNACEDCLENADNGPYDVGTDDPSIPEHPLCRCASTAVTGYE